jgi:adenosylmethionine-8-amino-7-oxononanoate aminotransferase
MIVLMPPLAVRARDLQRMTKILREAIMRVHVDL